MSQQLEILRPPRLLHPIAANLFRGCLIGQCLGDALGSSVEGQGARVCSDYVRALRSGADVQAIGRRGREPFGQYTDDSQLARELLDSVRGCGGFVAADYAQRISALFAEGRIFGYGRATFDAALRLRQGIPWQDAGSKPPLAGNGSAMRAAPIGLLFGSDSALLVRAAIEQGHITHQDPRCAAGSVAIAQATYLAAQSAGRPLEVRSYVDSLLKVVSPIEPGFSQAIAMLSQWVTLPPENAVTLVAAVGQMSGFEDRWPGISPYVVPSVLWSLYCFVRHPDSYLDAIYSAIACGGDVDTTAAMTGAISGARLGLDAIPSSWAEHLTDHGHWRRPELCALSDACHRLCAA